MRPSPFPPEISERLADARIGVAGAGGMGSHVATALVRSGIGHIVIADLDRVEARLIYDRGLLRRGAHARGLRRAGFRNGLLRGLGFGFCGLFRRFYLARISLRMKQI